MLAIDGQYFFYFFLLRVVCLILSGDLSFMRPIVSRKIGYDKGVRKQKSSPVITRQSKSLFGVDVCPMATTIFLGVRDSKIP